MLMVKFHTNTEAKTNWLTIEFERQLVELTVTSCKGGGGELYIYSLSLEDIATLRKALDEAAIVLCQDSEDKDCSLCGKPSPDGWPHPKCVEDELNAAQMSRVASND